MFNFGPFRGLVKEIQFLDDFRTPEPAVVQAEILICRHNLGGCSDSATWNTLKTRFLKCLRVCNFFFSQRCWCLQHLKNTFLLLCENHEHLTAQLQISTLLFPANTYYKLFKKNPTIRDSIEGSVIRRNLDFSNLEKL